MVRSAKGASDRSAYTRRGALASGLYRQLDRFQVRDTGMSRAWPAYRRRVRRRRRRRRLALTAGLLAALTALLLWRWAFPDSVVVLARREVPGSPVFFYQEDAAWSADTMGSSDKTLGKDGDRVACLASLMQMQQLSIPGIAELNPGSLNAWLTENGAYDRDGSLNWRRVGLLLGVRAVETTPRRGLGPLIERLLQEEVFPIVQVRRPDTGRAHDVLVVGSVHGEFVILDPLDPTDVPNTLGLYENTIFDLRYLK